MTNTPTDQVLTWIGKSEKILLVTGDNFTGDGICSVLALQTLLTRAEKEVMAVKAGEVPEKFKFLEGVKLVRDNLNEKGSLIISLNKGNKEVEDIQSKIEKDHTNIVITPKSGIIASEDISFRKSPGQFDLIIVCNTSNLESLGDIFTENTEFFAETPLINISADPDNEFFGKINLVDLTKSSSCEILFDGLYGVADFQKFFDVELSTIFLTGIISATNNFLESKTTANALKVAGTLQKIGARQPDIIEHLFKMKTLPMLKIWGVILENLDMDEVHQMAWSNASNKDFRNNKAEHENVGDLANDLLRHLNGTDLVMLFLETPEDVLLQIRVSAFSGINSADLQKIFIEKSDVVQNGINLKIAKTTFSQAKSEVLRKIAEFQENRLHLPSGTEVKKVSLQKQQEAQKADSFPMKTAAAEKPTVAPKAPDVIPFDVQKSNAPKEETENKPSEEPKQESKNIPEWLKKAQEKNKN